MVFTESTWKYFSLIPSRVRVAMGQTSSPIAFCYEGESFFTSYHALHKIWTKRRPKRGIIESLNIGRESLKSWENRFMNYGTVGRLPELSYISVDSRLEEMVRLIKSSRPHENASLAI